MKHRDLFELELKSVDWDQYTEVLGRPATGIGDAVRMLVLAPDPDACEAAYWCLENHVVVQGAVFSSAVPCVRALVAALVSDDLPSYVSTLILELIFQIIHGHPDEDEAKAGRGDNVQRAIDEARKGYWLFRREERGIQADAAREILDILDRTGGA